MKISNYFLLRFITSLSLIISTLVYVIIFLLLHRYTRTERIIIDSYDKLTHISDNYKNNSDDENELLIN